MYQLSYYVPEAEHHNLKQRLFEAGAGQFNNYDRCCWQTLGEGQFRPLEKSQAYIGNKLQQHSIMEYKVEMICQKQYLKAVLESLFKHHPYEQPAYHVVKVINIDDLIKNNSGN